MFTKNHTSNVLAPKQMSESTLAIVNQWPPFIDPDTKEPLIFEGNSFKGNQRINTVKSHIAPDGQTYNQESLKKHGWNNKATFLNHNLKDAWEECTKKYDEFLTINDTRGNKIDFDPNLKMNKPEEPLAKQELVSELARVINHSLIQYKRGGNGRKHANLLAYNIAQAKSFKEMLTALHDHFDGKTRYQPGNHHDSFDTLLIQAICKNETLQTYFAIQQHYPVIPNLEQTDVSTSSIVNKHARFKKQINELIAIKNAATDNLLAESDFTEDPDVETPDFICDRFTQEFMNNPHVYQDGCSVQCGRMINNRAYDKHYYNDQEKLDMILHYPNNQLKLAYKTYIALCKLIKSIHKISFKTLSVKDALIHHVFIACQIFFANTNHDSRDISAMKKLRYNLLTAKNDKIACKQLVAHFNRKAYDAGFFASTLAHVHADSIDTFILKELYKNNYLIERLPGDFFLNPDLSQEKNRMHYKKEICKRLIDEANKNNRTVCGCRRR